MKTVNEKKVKSIVTNSTKQLLNNNAKLLKQEMINIEESIKKFALDFRYECR